MPIYTQNKGDQATIYSLFFIKINLKILIDYIFVYKDSFHLDKWCESYGHSCFGGNLNTFLQKQLVGFISECNFYN